MQTIELVVKDKVLSFADGSPTSFLVSRNDNYVMHIDLDETRIAMFAVFVRDGQGVSCTIDEEGYVLNEQNERAVPEWALSAPVLTVGVMSNGYSSTPLQYCVRGSIKDFYSAEAVQPNNPLVEQLIALVNNIEAGITFTTDATLVLDTNNVLRVNTTNNTEEDNTLPITSAGVYTQVGNINALLQTI